MKQFHHVTKSLAHLRHPSGGVGKTTLPKLCLDQIQPSKGTATLGKRVKVNYIERTRMALDGSGSLLEEVAEGDEKRQRRENANRIQAAAAAREAEARRKAAQPTPNKPRKLTMAGRMELDSMEERIMETEDAIQALEAKLNDPKFQAEHFNEVPQVVEDLDKAKASTRELYARWEQLEQLAAAT